MNDVNTKSRNINLIIIVASLGYFVDIYDLVLFGVVRQASLSSLGLDQLQIKTVGQQLLNWQMAGMLIGGLFWGILGDKKGRISVLFGSILTYSLANIANGFVQTIPQYAVLRFLAGLGLAGELGAGITLVSETMHKDKRSIGTMIIATVGVLGAVVAGIFGEIVDNWRNSYFIGGAMGLVLLLMRIGIYESGMYQHLASESSISKGSLRQLFTHKKTVLKYMSIIAVGVPIWYVIGVLVTFAPETAKVMGMTDLPVAGRALTITYIGLALGDLSSGLISHLVKSRKKVLLGFIALTILCVLLYFTWAKSSLTAFYTTTFFLGFSAGYWAVFVSTASELFGTNLRSTVTTSAPNFVRGSLILTTILISFFEKSVGLSALMSIIFVGILLFSISLIGLKNIKETFGKDLDYLEE